LLFGFPTLVIAWQKINAVNYKTEFNNHSNSFKEPGVLHLPHHVRNNIPSILSNLINNSSRINSSSSQVASSGRKCFNCTLTWVTSRLCKVVSLRSRIRIGSMRKYPSGSTYTYNIHSHNSLKTLDKNVYNPSICYLNIFPVYYMLWVVHTFL